MKHPIKLDSQIKEWPHVALAVQSLEEGAGQVEDEQQLLFRLHHWQELFSHQIWQGLDLREASVMKDGMSKAQHQGQLVVLGLKNTDTRFMSQTLSFKSYIVLVSEYFKGAGVGVPLGQLGRGQQLGQDLVHAVPKGHGQVDNDQSDRVDPVRHFFSRDHVVALEDHVQQLLDDQKWLEGQTHDFDAGDMQSMTAFIGKLVEPPVHGGEGVSSLDGLGQSTHQPEVVIRDRSPTILSLFP